MAKSTFQHRLKNTRDGTEFQAETQYNIRVCAVGDSSGANANGYRTGKYCNEL